MKRKVFGFLFTLVLVLTGCSSRSNTFQVTAKEVGESDYVANHYNDMLLKFVKETEYDGFGNDASAQIISGGNEVTIILIARDEYVCLFAKYDVAKESLISLELSIDTSISQDEKEIYAEVINDIIQSYDLKYEYKSYSYTNSYGDVDVYSYTSD